MTVNTTEALGPEDIEARLKTGTKVLPDGASSFSSALLKLRPSGISGRRAQMSGVLLAWDSDVAGLHPDVPGTVLASTPQATTDQGTPALFQAGPLM